MLEFIYDFPSLFDDYSSIRTMKKNYTRKSLIKNNVSVKKDNTFHFYYARRIIYFYSKILFHFLHKKMYISFLISDQFDEHKLQKQ